MRIAVSDETDRMLTAAAIPSPAQIMLGGLDESIRVQDALDVEHNGADRLFRMDVDEFVLLLPETDLPGARIAAERLGKTVHNLSAEGRDGRFQISVRIGGASFPHERVQSSEDLLREANRSYRALRESDTLIFEV